MRVGLDVGGTKTDAVAVDDATGEVVVRVRRPTRVGPEGVVRTIVDTVHDLAGELGVAVASFASVGVGLPGQVDDRGERVAHAVNLGLERLEVASVVASVLGTPVRVENDVKAAALGAYAIERLDRSMAYLNLGTGVAAGIVVDGDLWRGARGAAGEVGHVSIDPRGPACRCGQRGCIEALAGGGAISERWGRAALLPVRDVFDAADAGDPRAVELRDGLARGVAAAVRLLVLTCDVDTVVLGGGLTALRERLTVPVQAALDEGTAASGFLRSLDVPARLRLLPPASPAPAFGAALVGAAATRKTMTHG